MTHIKYSELGRIANEAAKRYAASLSGLPNDVVRDWTKAYRTNYYNYLVNLVRKAVK